MVMSFQTKAALALFLPLVLCADNTQENVIKWVKTPGLLYACAGDDVMFNWEYVAPDSSIHIRYYLFDGFIVCAMYDNGEVIYYHDYQSRVDFILEGSNASMILKNVSASDSGMYRLQISETTLMSEARLTVLSDMNGLATDDPVHSTGNATDDSAHSTGNATYIILGCVGVVVLTTFVTLLVIYMYYKEKYKQDKSRNLSLTINTSQDDQGQSTSLLGNDTMVTEDETTSIQKDTTTEINEKSNTSNNESLAMPSKMDGTDGCQDVVMTDWAGNDGTVSSEEKQNTTPQVDSSYVTDDDTHKSNAEMQELFIGIIQKNVKKAADNLASSLASSIVDTIISPLTSTIQMDLPSVDT